MSKRTFKIIQTSILGLTLIMSVFFASVSLFATKDEVRNLRHDIREIKSDVKEILNLLWSIKK